MLEDASKVAAVDPSPACRAAYEMLGFRASRLLRLSQVLASADRDHAGRNLAALVLYLFYSIMPAWSRGDPMSASQRNQFDSETYKVMRWMPGHYGSLIETLAKCSHFSIAEAAYLASLPIYPKDYITLQIGARIVKHRQPGEESRGP